MTQTQFNEIDFRNQLPQVQGKWYYENYKKNMKVRQHLVMYDDDFGFQLTYHDGDEDCEGFAVLKMYINNQFNDNLGYYDYDKYADDPRDLLEDICVYIANRI